MSPLAPKTDRTSLLTDYERAVATWTYTNNKRAGASTRTLPEARCLYLAVRTGDKVFGVIGIDLKGRETRGVRAFDRLIDRR